MKIHRSPLSLTKHLKNIMPNISYLFLILLNSTFAVYTSKSNPEKNIFPNL
jgi:hypothetical protein